MGNKLAEVGKAIKDQTDKVKTGISTKRGLITGAALTAGALHGGKRGYKEDSLDRDVRQSMGLEEKRGWLAKNKGALIGGAASLAGGLGGRYLAKKSGLALGGLGTLAGIGIGSRIAGDVANKYVRQSNRRQIENELKNKQQSNFNNMFETRQFNKVTDFIKNNPKSVGAATGAVLGGGIGYMVDRKAKRQGNALKRNAGLAAGLAAGAGLGVGAAHFGPGLIAKIAKKKVVKESNTTDQLDPRMYSFWKNNKTALIAGGIGLGVGALGGIVKQRKKSNKAKVKGALVGAGIGAALGAGGAYAYPHVVKLLKKHSNVAESAVGAKPSDLKLAQRIKNGAKAVGNFAKTNWIGGAAGGAVGATGGALLGGTIAKRKGANVNKGRAIGGALGAVGGYAAGAGVQAGIRALRNRG